VSLAFPYGINIFVVDVAFRLNQADGVDFVIRSVASSFPEKRAMAQFPDMAGPAGPRTTFDSARPTRLMARIYRDIGLAAVANELALSTDDFEPELSEAVKRGARYIYLLPKPTELPPSDEPTRGTERGSRRGR
jgi:hypothetical protein